MGRIFAACVILLSLLAPAAHAIQPDEILPDEALEKRARGLTSQLRCMVCQNQSIDDSDAHLARDLRILVRERLVAGDSDDEVIEYLVGRYGEFVLLKPTFSARNLLLWGMPVLVLGGAGMWLYSRRRRSLPAGGPPPLSADEKARLDSILDKG